MVSTQPSAPPSHPIPSIALGEECVREAAVWLQRGFPAVQPARTKKVSDPVKRVCASVPELGEAGKSMHRLEQHTPAICKAGGQAWWEGRGAETCSQVLVCAQDADFGFIYLGCSSSMLNWQCVCVEQQSCLPTSSAARVPVQTFLNPSSRPDE